MAMKSIRMLRLESMRDNLEESKREAYAEIKSRLDEMRPRIADTLRTMEIVQENPVLFDMVRKGLLDSILPKEMVEEFSMVRLEGSHSYMGGFLVSDRLALSSNGDLLLVSDMHKWDAMKMFPIEMIVGVERVEPSELSSFGDKLYRLDVFMEAYEKELDDVLDQLDKQYSKSREDNEEADYER